MLRTIPNKQKIIVMLAVMSGLLLAALDQTIIATALGRIVEDFNSFSSLSWVITAYLLTSTITVPISGKLSDLYGRKTLLLVGVSLFGLASLLSGLSQNIEQLIAFRALQGIGGGILTSSAFTIIGDLFAPRERARWQGIIGAVFGLSSVIGPLLGGYLTDPHYIFGLITDWRWTFWINVPVGVLAFLMIAKYCPNFRHPKDIHIDYKGAAFLIVALSSTVLASENTNQIFGELINQGWSGGWIKTGLWSLAIIFSGLFIWAERRAKEPILPLHFFESSIFRIVMSVMLLFGAAFLGSILYLTQYLQQVLGTSPTDTGFALMPFIFSLSISSIVAGQVITRTGKYKVILLSGVALAGLGILWMSTFTADTTYGEVALRMLMTGIGLGMSMPIFNLIVQNDFSMKELGVATSSVQLARSLGSTVGTAVLGGLLTTGIAAHLGTITNDPYIKTLQQQPASSQLLQNADADAALQINQPDNKAKIKTGIKQSVEQSNLTADAKQQVTNKLQKQQDDFSRRVEVAFAKSMQRVFLVSASLMGIGFVIALFLEEVPLKHSNETTPIAAGH